VSWLLDITETLTPADHQTHRRYTFSVPPRCARLSIGVSYTPKRADASESLSMATDAVRRQAAQLSAQVGQPLADHWSSELTRAIPEGVRIMNLVTLSLDDAEGTYRGAAHRHAPEQSLTIAADAASPGLVAGPLPSGEWALTVSVHTLATPQCALSIQVGADTPTSVPSASRCSA
jgi:hypothetical protein